MSHSAAATTSVRVGAVALVTMVLVTSEANRPSSVAMVIDVCPVVRSPACPHASPPQGSGSRIRPRP
ncbi:hypothetical protein ACFQV2_14240 [Actinokineospora soli]|uniref:Secreted protein n=1 Tax=Actinokineospora soli TaxID=1048753 RepID=A0ABW2TL69_9PSEU